MNYEVYWKKRRKPGRGKEGKMMRINQQRSRTTQYLTRKDTKPTLRIMRQLQLRKKQGGKNHGRRRNGMKGSEKERRR